MDDLYDSSAPLIGLEISLAAVGLAGNLLVVLTILGNRSMRGLTNHLLLNLAVADSLVCATGFANAKTYECLGELEWALSYYYYVQRVVTAQSVLGLLLVTFERFVGIVHSLHHPRYFGTRRVAALLLLVWVTPLVEEIGALAWFLSNTTIINCTPHGAGDHSYDSQGDLWMPESLSGADSQSGDIAGAIFRSDRRGLLARNGSAGMSSFTDAGASFKSGLGDASLSEAEMPQSREGGYNDSGSYEGYAAGLRPDIVLPLLNTLLFFALPAAAMLWMYARILRSLQRGARELERLGVRGGAPRELYGARRRVVRVLLAVTAAFVLLILPDKVLSAVYSIAPDGVPYVATQWTLILVLANSAVNPFLYALLYQNFRRAARATLCCRRCAPNTVDGQPSTVTGSGS